MASEYYGINRGQLDLNTVGNITVGTSTGSTDIELRVDLTKGTTRKDVLLALRAFTDYLLMGGALTTTNVPIL